MVNKDEALKMALETLEEVQMTIATSNWLNKRVEALRTALAQPDVQIGSTYEEANPPQPHCQRCGKKLGTEVTDIHTCTPIRKEWVGLTDEEIEDIWGEPLDLMYSGNFEAIKNIEAKLKEKNSD